MSRFLPTVSPDPTPLHPTPLQAAILAEAREWLGVSYRHQASLKGVACDCLGLVRGIWREVIGPEPEAPPDYPADWAECGDCETLLGAARRHLVEIDPGQARPGDVLLFRMTPEALVKHCAILSALPDDREPQRRMIHAYWGRACVESWLGAWWSRRLSHAFSFPEIGQWRR